MRTNIFITIAFIWIAFIIAYALVGTCEASTKYYIVIGQSNAKGIVNYGDIEQRLSINGNVAKIIDCTKSGTKIKYFMPSWLNNTLYGNCLANVSNKNVFGIIFWQGESDTLTMDCSDNWAINVMTLLSQLRIDAGNNETKIIIIALNGLHNNQSYYIGWPKIRSDGLKLVAKNLIVIDSDNYPFSPGNIHLTQTGYEQISQDIADIFN